MGTAEGTLVESLVGAISLGGLLGREGLWPRRLFVAVVFVAELRGTITRADRQIRALAASVPVRELAIEVLGIGGILVAEPIPAFPDPVDVGVMEIEHRVASDRGEFGHVAAEGEMGEEVRVLVHPGIEPEVAGRRVDVELLVEGVQIDPVLVEGVDPFAPIHPGPARAVVQRGARVPEHGGDDEIVGVAGDRVPVGKRKLLILQHLADDPLELMQHQSMPGQEVPLLKLLGVGGVVGVGLAAVPHGLRVGSSLRRERRDHFRFELPGMIPQERRKALDPVGIPPPLP